MADVYIARLRAQSRNENVVSRIQSLFRHAGFHDIIGERDFVALKIHFGEPGNTAFIPPYYVRPIVDCVRDAGGNPFLTDSNTIYHGKRSNAVDHIMTAHRHGFLPSVVGAPVIIADGLRGRDYVKVRVDLKHFKEVNIASAALGSEVIIGITHFKGHLLAGFGGTIKNMGMGFASRSGKQMQHSDVKPEVDPSRCRACFECMSVCPARAIIERNRRAYIVRNRCIGCAECTATCRFGAIAVQWRTEARTFLEKMVEYAYGVLKDRLDRCGFYNFVINVTPECDCLAWSDRPIVNDLGILASRDPVAIDQASADLVNSASGLVNSALSSPDVDDKFRDLHNVPWEVQLEYAEELGLGERKYTLVEI